MQFIQHSVGNGIAPMGILVIFPTLRIGGIQVNDHGTLAVDTGGACIRIAGFVGNTVHGDFVGVVNTVQIAFFFGNPGALYIGTHAKLLQ